MILQKMNIDVDTTMETKSKPNVDMEDKLRKVEEKFLSKRTDERFTNYDGIMLDDNLSLDRVSWLEPLNLLDFGDFNCRPCPSNIFS